MYYRGITPNQANASSRAISSDKRVMVRKRIPLCHHHQFPHVRSRGVGERGMAGLARPMGAAGARLRCRVPGVETGAGGLRDQGQLW